jgi:hypothetical protein
MVRSLLVVPTGAGAGLARTCLGLVRALDRRGVNVAFGKPVAQPRADGGPDRSAALVAAITSLRPPDPLSTAELERQLAERGLHAALEKIIATLEPVHDRSDVVVVEALTPGPARLYAIEINQALAQALDADVLLVTSWPAPNTGSPDPGSPDPSRAPPGTWQKHWPSRLAGTGPASTRAWSAAWSTACLRIRLWRLSWARSWDGAGCASLPRYRIVRS